LAAIAALLYWLRWVAADIGQSPESEPEPRLDFKVVEERYEKVVPGFRREQVEELLGSPTERHAWDPDFGIYEEHQELWSRGFLPPQRAWDRWTDPQNQDRWVGVLYAGHSGERYEDQKVWGKLKKGF
jgi:hypothetical protein